MEDKNNFTKIEESIMTNGQGKNFFMPSGQPILVRTAEGMLLFDKGLYQPIEPWSVLNDAQSATDLNNFVSVVTLLENGQKRKILYTYPANAIYDPFSNRNKNSVLSDAEIIKFTDKKVEQLNQICQKTFSKVDGSYAIIAEIASMFSFIDKDAAKFLSSAMKSFHLNNMLWAESTLDNSKIGEGGIDDKLKVISVTEGQTLDMIDHSLLQLIDTNNSMWELGCYADNVADLRIYGNDSFEPSSVNISCLVKMTLEDNEFTKKVLDKVEELEEPNFKELAEFYDNAARFIRGQEGLSIKNKEVIGKLKHSIGNNTENVVEFFRAILSLDEAELHAIAKVAQNQANSLFHKIGQLGRY